MFFAYSSPRVNLQSQSKERSINSPHQADSPDLRFDRCAFQVLGESHYGACDQIECGVKSSVVCASEECVNCPCERHTQRCPSCQKYFCESSNRPFETCFSEHVRVGNCQEEILRVPLSKLAHALESRQHRELNNFINCNSDGLGHPLPRDVCINFGLAIAYSNGVIPEYNRDILIAQDLNKLEKRRQRQKLRRAAKKFGLSVPALPCQSTRLARHRNSTVHVATGALVVRQWTGRWHYPEQMEILQIMGLYRSDDFIRDRVDYLRKTNPIMFEKIKSWTTAMKKRC
jgi:hypothetical protein